ncbi:hypothetical protein TrispH2_006804 [Trichoplax sp. H2]|nr:hypothetical protein TrispH2_006804 [Trichoplax sp. H2]|eukprot:RDD42285.1 hypothetical protein TrispH2_006804 [Trichoplax sp. H2]
MKFRAQTIIVLILILQMQIFISEAGLLTYGLCQTACNGGWVTCYAFFGSVAGTVTAGVGTPGTLLACNSGQGYCMSVCAALFWAPTP